MFFPMPGVPRTPREVSTTPRCTERRPGGGDGGGRGEGAPRAFFPVNEPVELTPTHAFCFSKRYGVWVPFVGSGIWTRVPFRDTTTSRGDPAERAAHPAHAAPNSGDASPDPTLITASTATPQGE